MAFSRLFLYTILFTFLIGFLSCQDATEAPEAAAPEGVEDATTVAAEPEPEGQPEAGAKSADATAAPEEEKTEAVEETIVAEETGTSDPCSTVAADFAKCDEKTTSCELLKGYQSCVTSAVTGCDDATITDPIKEQAGQKETAAKEKLGGCEPVSTESASGAQSAGGETSTSADSTDGPSPVTEAPSPAQPAAVTPSKPPAPKSPATPAATTILNKDGAVAGPQDGDNAMEQNPKANETALPLCEEVVDKTMEVQRCNDKLENKGDICIQVQQVVDCVDKEVDCSHEVFDFQVEKYLQSLENYVKGHKCTITYRGDRLENRPKEPMTGESTDSGSSFVSCSLIISISTVLFSLFSLH